MSECKFPSYKNNHPLSCKPRNKTVDTNCTYLQQGSCSNIDGTLSFY